MLPHRILPLFLSALIVSFAGCTRDSTPSKVDVPGAQKEAPDSIVKNPQKPEKKVKITQALYDKIMAEKMTEAQVTEFLGSRRIMTEAQVTEFLAANQLSISPGASRVLIWEDSVGNCIIIEFIDGKARGGSSKIYHNR